MRSSGFADATTRRVLGVRALLERATPDSEHARQQWSSPSLLSSYEAVEALQSRTIAVEKWARHTSEKDHDRVRRQLAQMPLDIGRVLTKLELCEPLGETELFVLKRLLYHALRLCELAAPALATERPVPETLERLQMLLHTLHPEPEPTPRFHLSDALSRELADARKALTRARRLFMSRRKELLELKKQDYPGARFDLEGDASLPQHLATRAATDPGLTPHAGMWRLKDPDLDAHRKLVAAEQDLVEQLESSLRQRLSLALSQHAAWLAELYAHITNLDLQLTRIRLRQSIRGCWPRAQDSPQVVLEAGRDPAIDEAQPIDFDMDARPAIITGPNMGGKSSLLRSIGLCQWCVQHGLPAPANAFVAPLLHSMVYVGSDEVPEATSSREGLSSFGREVRRIVEARAASKPVTLWLFDEVGRGTHPEDGAALAAELITQCVERGDRVLFATHFPALAELDGVHRWRIAGLTDRARLEMLAEASDFQGGDALELALREAMDYRPVRWERTGDAVPRDARLIARLLGL